MVYPRFLVVEGNIGAGKTTLATMLSKQHNAGLILERFEDNPFLPKFYQDTQRYAFPLELSFMADRYKQLQKKVMSPELFENFLIADYYFMKSLIFAGITLSDDEYHLYRQLFDIIYKTLPRPDLYVYLHVPMTKLRQNIKQRNRDYEQGITSDYLNKLKDGYWEFFKQCDFPVLVLNTGGVDFVKNAADYKMIHDLIFKDQYPVGITIIDVIPTNMNEY